MSHVKVDLSKKNSDHITGFTLPDVWRESPLLAKILLTPPAQGKTTPPNFYFPTKVNFPTK